jgi:SAM-dependent methyltransferase
MACIIQERNFCRQKMVGAVTGGDRVVQCHPIPGEMHVKKLQLWARKPVHEQFETFERHFCNLKHKFFTYYRSLDFEGYIPRELLVAESEFSLANATCFSSNYSNFHLKRLLQEAISTGIEFENFIDVGCGKGKQCFYAARYFKFKQVIGIDFSPPLIQIAQDNLRKIPYPNFSFQVADARAWELPSGNNIVMLNNPFNEVILKEFLLRNLKHFQKYPSLVAYTWDVHSKAMQELGFEVLFRSHRHQHSLLRFAAATNPVWQTAEFPPTHSALR